MSHLMVSGGGAQPAKPAHLSGIQMGASCPSQSLPLQKWLILIFWWAQKYPVTDAKAAAEVDVGTAVDV